MFTEDGTYAVRKLKTTSNQLHLLYDASSTMNPKWENTPEYVTIKEAIFKRRAEHNSEKGDSVHETVEMLVLADHYTVTFNRVYNIEPLVLGILGTVASIYNDPSLRGPAMHVSLTRLILEMQPNLVTKGMDIKTVLHDFCNFQYQRLRLNETDPRHHDFAAFLTRYDLCYKKMTGVCNHHVVGLAPVNRMCSPKLSCVVVKDEGYASGFVLTHEMGHSLGMSHDGPPDNKCNSSGYVMSAIAGNAGSNSFKWSKCSAHYLRMFRGAGGTQCLRDTPSGVKVPPLSLPGYGDNGDLQCRLLVGPWAKLCLVKRADVCTKLWCRNSPITCATDRLPAVDGTSCGLGNTHVCYHGECVNFSALESPVNGGWGAWGKWSACSKTCGGGVIKRTRECNNPVPKFGGRYCQGERSEAKYCDSKACSGGDTFKQEQCHRQKKIPFSGKHLDWEVIKNDTGCLLFCKAGKMMAFLGIVEDGTSCSPEDGYKYAVCVTGKCKNVGCDKVFDGATLDRCGVCGGNGQSCSHVSKEIFIDDLQMGKVKAIHIPKNAKNVKIQLLSNLESVQFALKTRKRHLFGSGVETVYQSDSKWTYTDAGKRAISAKGPLLTAATIEILSTKRGGSLGVHYQYTY
jgi:hypothetical protein